MDLLIEDRHAFRLNQIEQITQIKVSSDDMHSSCSICISDFTKNEIVLILPCIHKFHRLCIKTWLTKNNTCPTCREPVFEDVTPVCDTDSSDDSFDVEIVNLPTVHLNSFHFWSGSDMSEVSDVSTVSDVSVASDVSAVSDVSNGSDMSSMHDDSAPWEDSLSPADTIGGMDTDNGDSSFVISDASSSDETDAMNESQISVSSASENSERSDASDEIVFPISSDESSDSDVMLYDSSDDNSD